MSVPRPVLQAGTPIDKGKNMHCQGECRESAMTMTSMCTHSMYRICIQYVHDMYTYVHDICTFICTHLPIFWDSWDWYPDIEEGRGESARSGCVESSANSASKGRFYLHLWQCWKLLEQTSTNPHLKTFQNLPVCRCRFHQLNSSKPVVNHVRDASISKTPYLTKFKRPKDLLRYQDTLAGVFLVVW